MRITKHNRLKIRSIQIDTRTWRDKTYGNTYYSTEAHCYSAQNKLVATVKANYKYGYSGAYHEVCRSLEKANLLKQGWQGTVRVNEDVQDGLQRDMKAWGGIE